MTVLKPKEADGGRRPRRARPAPLLEFFNQLAARETGYYITTETAIPTPGYRRLYK